MRLLLAFGAAVLVLLIVFFVALRAVGAATASTAPGFRLTPGRWQSTKPDDRSELQIKSRRATPCRAGPRERSRRSSGPLTPTAAGAIEVLSYRFGAADVRYMQVRLRDGKVFEVGRLTKSGPLPA